MKRRDDVDRDLFQRQSILVPTYGDRNARYALNSGGALRSLSEGALPSFPKLLCAFAIPMVYFMKSG